MEPFEQMAQFYPEPIHIKDNDGKDITIETFQLTNEQASMARIRNMGNPYWYINGLRGEYTYTRLMFGKKVMMSDTPMEIYTNTAFVDKSNGHVLMFGLGLGLCIPALLKNEKVQSITIIEKEIELIEAVQNALGKKLNLENVHIIQGNAYTWEPENGQRYDSIYFDIWPSIDSDNYPLTKHLHKRIRKFRNNKNPKSFTDSWVRDHIRSDWHELWYSKSEEEEMVREAIEYETEKQKEVL